MAGVFLYLLIFAGCFLTVSALRCRKCEGRLQASACNATHCVLSCNLENETCGKEGLCVTSLELNNTLGHKANVYGYCMLGGKSLDYLFSDRQIDGYCEHRDGFQLYCECGYDDCNHVLSFPALSTSTVPPFVPTGAHREKLDITELVLISFGAIFGSIFLIVVIVIVCRFVRRRSKYDDPEYECKLTPGSRLSSDDASIDGVWDESGKHSYSAYKYSSSVATQYSRGSRSNALNHNDQHLPIKLEQIIGRGRFAEVWKGKIQQEAKSFQVVSVKVFQLRNYGAWRQEKDMLMENWMRHDNIIEFYASEQRTVGGRLHYWLVTAYYGQGSLAEYLRSNILEWSQFCDMAISIANGLAYLHAEMDSIGRAKIPIAHRDVKSCNILVKDDCRSCVLADFGLSLKLDPELTKDELANAGQVGTSRYMAPELLERLVNLNDIEMFKRVDVYAMALVFWEMANRCDATEGMASPYKPPFGDQINDHPTKQEMLLLVCRDRKQPGIPEKWRNHPALAKFVDEILTEAWDYDAEARITSRCVYERLILLRDSYVTDDVIDETATKIREKAENEDEIPAEIISSVV